MKQTLRLISMAPGDATGSRSIVNVVEYDIDFAHNQKLFATLVANALSWNDQVDAVLIEKVQ